MNEIKLNIELTPAEADEVVAGLHNHSADLQNLAQRILISAQGQYNQIVSQQRMMHTGETEETKKDEEQKKEKGENK